MRTDKKIRILVAKIGCDIHERGALTLLYTLRDAGMEAIYTGRYQSPEGVVTAAIDEDVDVIALSDHTGSMPIIAESVIEELKKRQASDIHIMTGGLISEDDARELDEMGTSGNYGPGTPLELIVESVKALVHRSIA
ncbi:MAG: cobalamin-dependent protein [Deltaproteobacteria bacterium]|nr:cobalamin-dependent protein [Deltaproteobacteria bacterium]MBW1819075.1 cobalamin-dependent protein [Deltaproteobacteria bacterium]